MASLTLRSVKGAPLTNNEIDANFNNLNNEVSTKLNSSAYTAEDVLSKLLTVDTDAAGINASTLLGKASTSTNTADTVVLRDSSGNFSAGTITAALLSGDILLQAGKTISFEGTIDDNFETTLSVVNPTADRTLLLPNISGTLITSADTSTVTNTMLAGSIANSKLSNSSITIDGVVVSLGGSISLLNANNIWNGIQSFADDKFSLKDNVDPSKVASFQLSNLSPGASRSMIIPDETGIIATQAYVNSGDSYLNSQIAALTTAKGYISFNPTTGAVFASKKLSVVRNAIGYYTVYLDGSIQTGNEYYAPLVGAVDSGTAYGDTGFQGNDQSSLINYYGGINIQTISTQQISATNFVVRSVRRYNSYVAHGGGNDGNSLWAFGSYDFDPSRITVVVF